MTVQILKGDCREALPTLPDESVQCVVTSPPYWGLRDYGVEGQIGLERDPAEYIESLVQIFRHLRRILRQDGTVWLNLGDSYAASRGTGDRVSPDSKRATNAGSLLGALKVPRGPKAKDLVGIPWSVAFALRADGWYLRQDIIWSKPNPMPESVTDRCTKAHEYIFLLSKGWRYYYDQQAIAEPCNWPEGSWGRSKCYDGDDTGKLKSFYGNGAQWKGGETRNKRSVWEVATQPFSEAHFATFPPDLIEPCIKAGCPEDGTVLDPFGGAGTTGLVADRLKRNAILIELNHDYAAMAERRIRDDAPLFVNVG